MLVSTVLTGGVACASVVLYCLPPLRPRSHSTTTHASTSPDDDTCVDVLVLGDSSLAVITAAMLSTCFDKRVALVTPLGAVRTAGIGLWSDTTWSPTLDALVHLTTRGTTESGCGIHAALRETVSKTGGVVVAPGGRAMQITGTTLWVGTQYIRSEVILSDCGIEYTESLFRDGVPHTPMCRPEYLRCGLGRDGARARVAPGVWAMSPVPNARDLSRAIARAAKVSAATVGYGRARRLLFGDALEVLTTYAATARRAPPNTPAKGLSSIVDGPLYDVLEYSTNATHAIEKQICGSASLIEQYDDVGGEREAS